MRAHVSQDTIIEIGKAYLRKKGMKTYKGHKTLTTRRGEVIHMLRGVVIPGQSAIRCMIEQDPCGKIHPPRLMSRSEKKSLKKFIVRGR